MQSKKAHVRGLTVRHNRQSGKPAQQRKAAYIGQGKQVHLESNCDESGKQGTEQDVDLPFAQPERDRVLRELSDRFDRLGRRLPAGQDLKIDVPDLDLAGRLYPNARGGQHGRQATTAQSIQFTRSNLARNSSGMATTWLVL
jgi:hypothetical protein